MGDRQSKAEFLGLMAAASATIAIAIDAMLPAFAAVRDHFELPATSSDIALIISVFMAGIGVGQFVYGPLADRFGRKPVFIAGLVLYVVAGFATTFASSLDSLLVGRFFWGLGAAGPRVVSQAMLRDRYKGDELARAMAIILTVFLVVPTLAPIIGQALLEIGPWRYTFAVGPVFATVVALWSTRASESLSVSKRRPIDVRSIGRAIKEVVRTPSALGNTLAIMMMTAAFLPYLASSERMYGEIYGRGEEFFLWFAATSIVMAGFTLTTTKLVTRYGTKRTSIGLLSSLLIVSGGNLLVTYLVGGVPSFAFFFVATTIVVSLNTALSPLLASRSLNDVGHIAGTAASTIGGISFLGASVLSPLVDGAIDDTITPFAAGCFAFALAALLAALLADHLSQE